MKREIFREDKVLSKQPVSSVLGCTRGVMVIVIGNGHGDMSSNPG